MNKKKFVIFLFIICLFFIFNSNFSEANTLADRIFINPNTNKSMQYEQYNPNRPEWIEFCPIEYIDANYDNRRFVPYYSRMKSWENNYWVNRKHIFNQEVAKCDAISQLELKNSCYSKVRRIQYAQNDNFKQTKMLKIQEQNNQDMYGIKQIPQNINVNYQYR